MPIVIALCAMRRGILSPALLQSQDYHRFADVRLVWDRLPMTIAFMSLVAAVAAGRISVRTGNLLLVPLVLVGLASVVYWLLLRALERRARS